MKSSSKILLKYLIPPIALQLFLISKRIVNGLKYNKILNKNIKLKSTAKNKDAVFIGNGPSLVGKNLEEYQNYDLIVCNDFYLHKAFDNLNIKYFINLDPTKKWIDNIKNILHKETVKNITFILPISSKLHIEKIPEFKDFNIFYIFSSGETEIFNKFFINISKAIIHIRNITQFVMIFSNYVGYDNVYFLGVDMNQLAYKTKLLHPHFYKNEENVSHVPVVEEGEYSRNALSLSILFRSIKELNNITSTNFFNSNQDSFLEFIDFRKIK